MSSSRTSGNAVQAVRWALDEFAMPDIFPMSDDAAMHTSMEHEIPSTTEPVFDRAQIEADAYGRGRADAERTARAQAEADVASTMLALRDATTSVQLHEARWIANAEENIAALAVAVARHILAREVATDATHVRELVTRALEQFPLDSQIVVRLHPDDIAVCNKVTVNDSTGRVSDVRWTADSQVLRGGCLIEGRERIIDGRIDTSLERAYRSIGNLQA